MKRFVLIEGEIQPYTTTTHRAKWAGRPEYERYKAYKQKVVLACQRAMALSGWDMIEKGIPLRLAVIYNAGQEQGRSTFHVRDMTNILKGTEDGAQGVLYGNDSWVDQEMGFRVLTQEKEDRLLLVVEPVEEGEPTFYSWLYEVYWMAKSIWGFDVGE